MNEQLQRAPQRMTFSQYVNSKTGQALIANTIKSPAKRDAFVTAIVSAVSVNPGLQECTSASIISAALQGVALGLAPSPQLGQFYMVPFKNKKAGTTEAQFVPGYKGYIQLAYRSGQYLDIDARPVVEGEYKGLDRFTGRPIFEWIEDDALREQLPVVGYMAYFELVNGARKVLYWSKEKMLAHADRYSPAFDKDAKEVWAYDWDTKQKYKAKKVSFADYEAGNFPSKESNLYSSFWYKNFDGMAEKTMLRQLITKWGPVSIEMESAINQDAQNEAQGVDYGAGDFTDAALPAAPESAPKLPEAAAEPEPAQEEQVNLDEL